jgi:hypothetical protein
MWFTVYEAMRTGDLDRLTLCACCGTAKLMRRPSRYCAAACRKAAKPRKTRLSFSCHRVRTVVSDAAKSGAFLMFSSRGIDGAACTRGQTSSKLCSSAFAQPFCRTGARVTTCVSHFNGDRSCDAEAGNRTRDSRARIARASRSQQFCSEGWGTVRDIGEKFSVHPATGTGSLTVPIGASQGRSGFGPLLSLASDSATAEDAQGEAYAGRRSCLGSEEKRLHSFRCRAPMPFHRT